MLLGLFNAIVTHQSREHIRLKSHGTGMHTLTTADASRLGITASLSLIHHQHAGITLDGGGVEIHDSLAHHGAATDNLAGGGRQLTDSVLDDVIIGGANANLTVVLRGQLLTRDSKNILDERFVFLDGLVDGECSAEIGDYASNVLHKHLR